MQFVFIFGAVFCFKNVFFVCLEVITRHEHLVSLTVFF